MLQTRRMAERIRVRVLEAFGPSKFSVRPEVNEEKYYLLERSLDCHYVNMAPDEEIPLSFSKGDAVWWVTLRME